MRLLVPVLLFRAALAQPELDPVAGMRIVELRVVGNERVSSQTIREALAQRVGEPFDPAQTSEDLRRLFALGQFADVDLSVERVPGGVVYVVRVEELPLLGEVRFSGAERLQPEELRDAVALEPGEPVGSGDIARALQALEALYDARGFARTEIAYRLEPAPGDRADLFFHIHERPRVRVAELRILGVDEPLVEAIRGALPLREANLFTQLAGTGYFTQTRLERGEHATVELLADRGFLQARVDANVTLGPDEEEAFVTFAVEPGPRFRVDALELEGELVPTREELLRRVSLARGEVLSREALRQDIAALTTFLYDRGHACARVTPVVDLDPATATADLTLRIEPGPQVVVGDIEVVGNELTRDRVVRRELAFEPGEPFSAEALQRSVERLRELGLFRSVAIEPRACEQGRVRMVVRVEEGEHLAYQASVGFASAENVVGTARIAERNLFGTGRTLSAMGQVSSLRTVVDVDHFEPYLLGTVVDATLTGSYARLSFPEFRRTAYGGNATFRLPFERVGGPRLPLMASLAYGLHSVSVEASPELAALPSMAAALESGLTSLVAASVAFDRRDDPLIPRRGFLINGLAELSPGFLGATLRFARYSLTARGSVPLGQSRLQLRGSLAYLQSLTAGPTPLSERFFVGGFGTVRGYRFRSISPVETLLVPNQDPVEVLVGGDKRVLLGAELELPLAPRFGLFAVAFWDAGNAYGPDEPLFMDTQDDVPLGLFHAVGPGIRWFTPAGPVRLELAFPLEVRPGDAPVVLELGLGTLP